jgi:hypothetical protein
MTSMDDVLGIPKKRHKQIIELLTILHKQLTRIEKELIK